MLPPGPRGRLRSTLQLMNNPVGAAREWRATYGKTFGLRVIANDWIVTCDPELVRAVHAAHEPGLFCSGAPEGLELVVGPRSLLRMADQNHHRDRKLLMPPFHGERMRDWGRTMADIGRRAFKCEAEGDSIRAVDRTRIAALEIILRVVFGVRDDARVALFRRAIEDWTSSTHPSFIFLPFLARDWLGLSPYARYRKFSQQLDEMLYEQIAAVRAQQARMDHDGPSDDVLSMLVHARYDDGTGMDDAALRDNLRTILIAGHESTAVTLGWALWFVHRDPKVLARLHGELDALGPNVEPDALSRVPYLMAVVDETLRMRPIASEIQRRLAKPWKLGEWELDAGVTIGINMTLLHYEPDLWERPEQFEPERFMGPPPSPWIYEPFGGGSRRCLGATFARYEAAIVLGTLLREFEFEVLDDEVEWKRKTLILEPLSGINVRVRQRELQPQRHPFESVTYSAR